MKKNSFYIALSYLKVILSVNTLSLKWTDFLYPSTLHLSPFLDQLLEPVKSNKSCDRTKLGLQEALVNAVIHGNSRNHEKFIRVRFIISPKWFIWQIQDQGTGVPRDARISLLPLEIDSSNGRGLFLIAQCFDDVRLNLTGISIH